MSEPITLRIVKRGMNFSQDGPGNRMVFHLQGCNFHCPWCSNPESIPLQGVMLHGKRPHFSCESVPISDILSECLSAKVVMFEGGGATFTGGEPTLQFHALHILLQRLKEHGIHTAIETNASHPQLHTLVPLIDFLIADCKHYDARTHFQWTGHTIEEVSDNFRKIGTMQRQCLIRIPLIGGVNASVEDAEKFVEYFQTLGVAKCPVELLRYHEYGRSKWEQCGWSYAMQNAQVGDEALAAFQAVLQREGIVLVNT